jgi:two-component system phosphate regulon sensor histidine kinase PhoR
MSALHGTLIAAFTLGAALGAGPLCLLLYRRTQQDRALHAALERLAREAAATSGATHLAAGPYPAPLQPLQQLLAEQAQKLAEAEHARAALEIRCRRHSDQSARVARILASLPDPLLAIDRYDQLLLCNPSAQRLFQVDPNQDQHASKFLGDARLNALVAEMYWRPPGVSRSEDFELTHPDHGRRWYRATVTALSSRPNDPECRETMCVSLHLRDITQLKVGQWQHAEFVSAASHEMKTPLAGIKAYVELLADGDTQDEATREQFLGIINAQTERLERLIENLLNLARIEAGVIRVSKHPQSLNEILQEAHRVVQPSAQAKPVTLELQLSPLYLPVLADRDLLLQAAINLLSNAVKYTPAGGKIWLRSRLEGDRVEFEVEDTGVGLSPEDCERVFEKFYRVEKNRHMAGGTGLGLPLARHIVQDVHGGTLSVISTLGQGSTFRASLPAAHRPG